MTITTISITIIASLLSGLAGALLSTIVYIRRESRKFKIDTLKRFAANRFDFKGDEFSRALNEIFVVYNDSSEVMKALAEFHKAITSKQKNDVCEDALVKLYKSMCDNTSINLKGFNDSFFLTPFNTKPYCMVPQNEGKTV